MGHLINQILAFSTASSLLDTDLKRRVQMLIWVSTDISRIILATYFLKLLSLGPSVIYIKAERQYPSLKIWTYKWRSTSLKVPKILCWSASRQSALKAVRISSWRLDLTSLQNNRRRRFFAHLLNSAVLKFLFLPDKHWKRERKTNGMVFVHKLFNYQIKEAIPQ